MLKNNPQNSVIIMDNTPYHSVVKDEGSTVASRNEETIQWLKHQNISMGEDIKKATLMMLVLLDKPVSNLYC